MEDKLNNISNFVSIFFLVWSESSYIPKISPQACLILEIDLKKTLKYRFGRRTKQHFQFFSIFILVWFESSYIPKINHLACLIFDIYMKKTLKLGFGRRPQQNIQIFLNIVSSLVRIKLHTKNQPPSLIKIGMKKTLKLRFGGRHQNKYNFLSQYFF